MNHTNNILHKRNKFYKFMYSVRRLWIVDGPTAREVTYSFIIKLETKE